MAGVLDLGTLVIHLAADVSKYNKVLNKAERDIQSAADRVSKIGTKMTLAVTAPLVGLGAWAVKEFSAFDQALTESFSIMGDVSDELRQQMIDNAKDIAAAGTKAPAELARAYYYLVSAGLTAEQQVGALSIVTKFSTAGQFDLARATDLLTDSQTALGMASQDTATHLRSMARLSDVLTRAEIDANASVEQFAISLTTKAGNAIRAVNKDVEEGVAVLAAYADQGIKAERAGEQLHILLRDLSRAARENKEVWASYGVSVFDASGEMRNVADIIADLEGLLGSMSVEQRDATLSILGFRDLSIAATRALIGYSDRIREMEQVLRGAAGITEEVANKQMRSFQNQLKAVWNQIRLVAIEIGAHLAPVLSVLSDTLAIVIKAWNILPGPVQSVLIIIAALNLAIAALVGPFLKLWAVIATGPINLKKFAAALAELIRAQFMARKEADDQSKANNSLARTYDATVSSASAASLAIGHYTTTTAGATKTTAGFLGTLLQASKIMAGYNMKAIETDVTVRALTGPVELLAIGFVRLAESAVSAATGLAIIDASMTRSVALWRSHAVAIAATPKYYGEIVQKAPALIQVGTGIAGALTYVGQSATASSTKVSWFTRVLQMFSLEGIKTINISGAIGAAFRGIGAVAVKTGKTILSAGSSLLSMAMGWQGLLVAAGAYAIWWGFGGKKAMEEQQKAAEETRRLIQKNTEVIREKTRAEIDHANAITDPKKRTQVLQKSLEDAEKALGHAQDQLARWRKAEEEATYHPLNPVGWIKSLTGENSDLTVARENIEHYTAEIEAAKESVKSFQDAVNKAGRAAGLDIAPPDLEAIQAAQEQLERLRKSIEVMKAPEEERFQVQLRQEEAALRRAKAEESLIAALSAAKTELHELQKQEEEALNIKLANEELARQVEEAEMEIQKLHNFITMPKEDAEFFNFRLDLGKRMSDLLAQGADEDEVWKLKGLLETQRELTEEVEKRRKLEEKAAREADEARRKAEQTVKDMEREAEQLRKQLETPEEALRRQSARLVELRDKGLITQKELEGGFKLAADAYFDAISKDGERGSGRKVGAMEQGSAEAFSAIHDAILQREDKQDKLVKVNGQQLTRQEQMVRILGDIANDLRDENNVFPGF